MMSAARHSAGHRLVGFCITTLLLCLAIIAHGVTAADPGEASQTPTSTPTPEHTTLAIGSAPLTLTKTASTDAVLPGQSFTYTLRITSNRDQARIEVRDMLDRGVEVIGIESASGACTGTGMIMCTVQVTAQEPATILITVRASATVAPNSLLIGQALAQDDRDFTAASERVAVRVVAPLPSMSAPVATLPPSPEAPSADAAPPPDAPESRAALRTGAVLSRAPLPTATIFPPPVTAPLSRAASAMVGATDPGSAAPIDAPTQAPAAAPNTGSYAESWLDLVTTVNP
ncbi:hypothetical protein [Roseiflexus castenholzii]|uniref:hypothetical protein n=1 Tax=Roseiflexus castenholzii TaxID=120962 RepID=UPI003C7C60EC